MTQFNNNLKLITENKKPFEIVQEVNNEIPSYEEFMRGYENDKSLEDSYNNEISSYGDISNSKGYGPMYQASNAVFFSIKYKFNHSGDNRKNYFEQSGSYSNKWEISGSLDDIKCEQWKLEDGKIRVVVLNQQGSYEINKHKEEEVKDQLRRDVRTFELWRCGNPGNIEREFEDIVLIMIREERKVFGCPQKYPQILYTKK